MNRVCLYRWRCGKCRTISAGSQCVNPECRSTVVGESLKDSPRAELFYGDCITGMIEVLQPESVDNAVTSPPFEELFAYSGKPEDVGNNGSTIDIRAGRFALNMRFVVEGLLRVLKPGCNACIHIQQLLAYKVQHGFMGRRDFRGAMVDVFTVGGELPGHEISDDGHVLPFVLPPLRTTGQQGFQFIGEFVIPKNPQQMAQRLNLHSLQFKTGYARDSNKLAPAVNDYVLIFQKPGNHPTPPKSIRHEKQNPQGWVSTEEWIRDASGNWTDILEIDVLDGARGHKEKKEEKHVCPLQLEVVRRLVRLYTNPISIQPNVTVLDPFGGIMSTPYIAIGGKSPVTKLGVEEPRNAVAFELKESYFRGGVNYCTRALAAGQQEKASERADQPGLYDEVPESEVPSCP